MIMTQRNQHTKKLVASVKARKWEKLVGWSIEPDYDSSYIDIEAWSKRRYNEGTVHVEYLCSNNHFCSGISDWNSFIEASLEKQGKDAASIEYEEIKKEDGSNTEEVYEKAKKELHKSVTQTAGIEINSPTEGYITEPITLNKEIREQSSSVENGECTRLNDDESKRRCVRVRPISSNSLPEKKLTCRSMPPRRNALSANDAYTDDISSPSIKFSYTKKDTSKPMVAGSLNFSSRPTDNDVSESSSGQNERLAGYDFHRLQLHQGYVLPKSANVSIGDLLQSHPRIERHFRSSRDRDIVFAALAKDKDNNFSEMIRHHLLNDNTDTNHTSVGLPPVNQKTINKDRSKGVPVPVLKTMSSTPRIPLLSSKSTDEILLQQFDTDGTDLRDEPSQDVTSPIYSYVTHAGCSDVDVNYTPKTTPNNWGECYTTVIMGIHVKPRGPPAFRPPTSKTPLHRAIQTAHKKIHGPHHHLLSQSGSRLTDKVEASTEKRRWSSSLPSKHVRHTDAVSSDVNNMNTWRQELEKRIRYQRSTSNSKATARVNAPLTNPLITTNNTTITLSKLSRRKKTQLRIGDKLYNVGTIQTAGRTYARINVKM
ncbi:uncharacterized protein LOC117101229 isoform X2 [Anneissia japonica]|uniref:uncharacterized protein LOC117101229 isoform X2 n=1 Tax=Anneissia japonica TaxID=1529436 RepID=UPI00142589C8|nr:uncharacterized protein LOC117101229 isoform X2 [Anneissia japonica]